MAPTPRAALGTFSSDYNYNLSLRTLSKLEVGLTLG